MKKLEMLTYAYIDQPFVQKANMYLYNRDTWSFDNSFVSENPLFSEKQKS